MTQQNSIPAIETATEPINSAADLHDRWRALMGNLGFGERLLWLGFVGTDRTMYKTLSQVPVGRSPDHKFVENLLATMQSVVDGYEPGLSVALLLSRPGVDGLSAEDRLWSQALKRGAARFGLPIEPMFRANDAAIVPM